jgi:hypothetical protein
MVNAVTTFFISISKIGSVINILCSRVKIIVKKLLSKLTGDSYTAEILYWVIQNDCG